MPTVSLVDNPLQSKVTTSRDLYVDNKKTNVSTEDHFKSETGKLEIKEYIYFEEKGMNGKKFLRNNDEE